MDLEKLDSIDTTKPDQVKDLQRWLQTRGMLPQGKDQIDGKWGGKTTEGFQKARQQLVDAQNNRRGIAEAEREANDPVNKAINMGIEVAPYAAGVGTGTAVGRYAFGRPFERMDERQGESASKLAKDPNISPQVKQDQLSRMTRRRAVRNTAQFGAPALLGGAGYATQNYIAPMFSDPDLQNTIRTVGTGENAAALTLGLHQVVDTLRRGNPVSDVDEARIRSDASGPGSGPNTPLAGSRGQQNRLLQSAASPSTPPAPPSSPPALPPPASSAPSAPVRHSDRLRQAVSATGAKPGRNKAANVDVIKRNLSAQNLAQVAEALNLPTTADRRAVLQRLREIVNIGGKMSLPIAVAAATYAATGSPSEASTGGEAQRPDTSDRLAAAGTAGAAAYGVNRLLQAVPVAGGPLAANSVMSFDPLEGGSEEDTRHNIMAARGDLNALLPSAGRAIGVTPQEQSAYQIAQVPTPSPSRVQRQADTRQDAEYMRRYLDDEPVNMPASVPGWQDRAAAAPDPFDADLAELASLLAELEGPAEPQRRSAPVVMPNPVMVSPALQNRLLAGR